MNSDRADQQLVLLNHELETLCYSISHDLRAPLRSITGFSEALVEDAGASLNEECKKHLDRICSATRKMGEMIDGMLKVSRVTQAEMKLEEIDLSAAARDVVVTLRRKEARPTEISIQDGLVAWGDSTLIQSALYSLIENAWKFSAKNPSARIEFGRMQTSSGTTYFVRDNGVGLDLVRAKKLFAPFQRFHHHNDFPGLGIGLATLYRAIGRHGGKVWVESEVSKGATFFFTLNA